MSGEIKALENKVSDLKIQLNEARMFISMAQGRAKDLKIRIDETETDKARMVLESQARQEAISGCPNGECE